MQPFFFDLKPFEATALTDGIIIRGVVSREQNQISIHYLLCGDLSRVEIAPPGSSYQSRDSLRGRSQHLWEKTCFEIFLRPVNPEQSHYWEFNLSPAGDWNVFALSDYRAGLREERAIAILRFTTQRKPNQFQLDASVDIGPILNHQDALIGISTVLIIAGQESYWAIAHPGPTADFHHPDSFVLSLPS